MTVVVEADRRLSYTEVEAAVNAEGWLSDYLINLRELSGRSRLTLQVNVPTSAITAEGVPRLDAVPTLESVARVLAVLDR